MRLVVDVEAAPPSSMASRPLLVLGALHPFTFEVGGQLFAVKWASVGEHAHLLLHRPHARTLGFVVGHDRQTTRLLQPARQILLPNPGLPRQLQCTHRAFSGQPLNHLLFESYRKRLAHVIVAFSPLRGASQTTRQLSWHRG